MGHLKSIYGIFFKGLGRAKTPRLTQDTLDTQDTPIVLS